MLQATIEVLRASDFLAGERIDRKAIALSCCGQYEPRAVSLEGEIQDSSLITAETRHLLFGDVDGDVEAELDVLISQLTGPNGHVQDALADGGNGFVLCASRVQRTLSNGGGSITITRSGKFITKNVDLIEQYYWGAGVDRYAQSIKALNDRVDLAVERQPTLADRKPNLIAKVYARLQLEMPKDES